MHMKTWVPSPAPHPASPAPENVSRFIREIRVLARLRHPNLILWMGYIVRPEPCIVTEFMSRGSLFQLLAQKRAERLMSNRREAGGIEDDSLDLNAHGTLPGEDHLQEEDEGAASGAK